MNDSTSNSNKNEETIDEDYKNSMDTKRTKDINLVKVKSRCMKKSNVSYLNFAGTRFRCLCSCMSVLFKADNIIIYRCRVSLSPVSLQALFLLFSSR